MARINMTNQSSLQFNVPTVSEFTGHIKQLLERNFNDVLVEGEASNVKKSANGHIYFTLKDAGAQLPCVIWRGTAQQLSTQLSDGQQIIVGGDLQVYAPHGRYQLIVSLVQQAGIGKLQQAFEALKAKLQKEGLFDEGKKKPLPKSPRTIGVVTSRTTAAFQDIISTLEKRWPLAKVILHHAGVQGVNAAPEIARGIDYFSEKQNVDVVIITRGGGSLEDLWPFNEEVVARAIYKCTIPLISAVGHEIDFSISDFVADVRAATPTQAAVLATPDINEVQMYIEDLYRRMTVNTVGKIQLYKEKVVNLGKSHSLLVVRQKIKTAEINIATIRERLAFQIRLNLRNNKEKTTRLLHRLEKMNPNIPLDKGFVRVWQNDKWIRDGKNFQVGNPAQLEWKDNKIDI